MMREMALAAKLRAAQEEKSANLEAALAQLRGGDEKTSVTLPSGIRVRLKRPPLSQLLGGNPLDPDGTGGDDELLKMLKVTRGN